MTIPTNPGGEKVHVTPNVAEGIFVRSGAGPQFTPVASAFIGDGLELVDPTTATAKIGLRGEWIQVRAPSGVTGWVNAKYVGRVHVGGPTPSPAPVTPARPPEPTPPQPVAPVSPVAPSGHPPLYLRTNYPKGQYIRSGPGSEHPDVGSINTDQKVEALGDRASNLAKLGKQGEWIQVRAPQGVVGWAAAWYLEVMPEIMVWNEGHALAGLHGPTEAWADRWDEGAFRMISEARIEAVKLLASNDLLILGPGKVAEIVNRLRGLGVRFIMARLFAKFESPKSPQEFANDVGPAAKALLDAGVRHFEVHNEPNLNIENSREGMFVAWQNGQQFGEFYQQAVAALKQNHGLSDAYFGFPGLSPVTFVEPQRRYLMSQFLAEADPAVRSADFVCMHNYWGGDGSSVQDALNQVKAFCQKYPNKVIFVTEFANTSPHVGKDVKGNHYAQYYNAAKSLPRNLGAVFAYVMKSAGDYDDQTWSNSQIPQLVGARRIS